jgi:hypothetical protein
MCGDQFDNEELVALRKAFEQACAELGLGTDKFGNGQREHLAILIFSLAREGAEELATLQRRAVAQMLHPSLGKTPTVMAGRNPELERSKTA